MASNRWSLVLFAGLTVACTKPNPAFDGDELADASEGSDPSDEGESEAGESSADGDGDAETTGDGDGDDEPATDLPVEPVCGQPADGLAITLGDPGEFGGGCPTAINVFASVITAEGGSASFNVCGPGCTQCSGEIKLSAYPLTVTNYFPTEAGTCLTLRAEYPTGQDPSTCFWGALSVRDAVTQAPYVFATAHSAPPTQDALADIGLLIPEPVKGLGCSCDEVGLANNCCFAADPPEFWYFPWQGEELYAPYDYALFELPQWQQSYYFKVLQAQRIGDCLGDQLQLSWAITAAL